MMVAMIGYIKESWRIFAGNLEQISDGWLGVGALVFLFAVFLVFWNISKGFGSRK